jgi:hypothetical protein
MSDEQPRWPAGTPVDEHTGAGGGRFAPKNRGAAQWRQPDAEKILDTIVSDTEKRDAILKIRAMAVAEDDTEIDSAWQPVMNRADADVWSRDGYFKEDVYHITKSDNIAAIKAIKTMGFRYKGSQYRAYGRVWGDGIYVSTNKDHSNKWFDFMVAENTNIERLTIRTNVKNPLVIKVERDEEGNVTTRSLWDSLEEKHPGFGEMTRSLSDDGYQYNHAFRKSQYADAHFAGGMVDFPAIGDYSWFAFRETLRHFGYDSIYVDEQGFNVDSAGDQLVVFSPRNLVIVDQEAETWSNSTEVTPIWWKVDR